MQSVYFVQTFKMVKKRKGKKGHRKSTGQCLSRKMAK